MKIAVQKLNIYYKAQRKKFSHKEIAEKLGISITYLHELLKDEKSPSQTTAKEIESIVKTIKNDWNREV